MKLVTVSEMRKIELEADKKGLTFSTMMENAGSGLADEIELLAHIENDERQVLGLVGAGNNGGDTLIALTHLAASGWRVRAYVISEVKKHNELYDRLRIEGGEIMFAGNDPRFDMLIAFLNSADVVVDGVLGTGFHPPLEKSIAEILMTVNNTISDLPWPPYVVAVDCPSGLDCDTGVASDAVIPASLTVCMGAVKLGLVKLPANDLIGELRVVDIGLQDSIESWASIQHYVVDQEMVKDILPVRAADSHKGTFGTALVIAGSINYVGAPFLAGKAAYKSGAGLVQLAVPGPVQIAVAGRIPEAIWVLLPQEMGVISENAAEVVAEYFDRARAVLIGPGMGTEETTRSFIELLLKDKGVGKRNSTHIGFTHFEPETKTEKNTELPPFVVDADGLRLLSRIKNWEKLLPENSILTPHPGEMSELTGLSISEIQEDRQNLAAKYASTWGHVVVLKGAFTVIADPAGRTAIIPVASSALAHAGTGDVLAGIIVGLRAQGMDAYEAALAGAWIHAQAGLYSAEKVGCEASVMASDVIDAIAEIIGTI